MSTAGSQVAPFQRKSAEEVIWLVFPLRVIFMVPLVVMWVMPSNTTLKSPFICICALLQSTE